MQGSFILDDFSEKHNRIAHRILELVEFIDDNWRKVEQQVEAISRDLHSKLEGEQGHDR